MRTICNAASFLLSGRKGESALLDMWMMRAREKVLDHPVTVMHSLTALVTPVISEQRIRETQVLTGSCSEWARWEVLASMLLCNPAALLRWDSWNQDFQGDRWGLRQMSEHLLELNNCKRKSLLFRIHCLRPTSCGRCLASPLYVAKFIFKMPLLSAGPVYSLEHSLEVWEVWVTFSCQPRDAGLHLPAVQRVAFVARLGWGVSSYLPAARAEPLLQQRPWVLETSRRTNEGESVVL